MGQMQLCHVQAGQGGAAKVVREKGIAGGREQGMVKSCMLGCLDIGFCEWDAADIARQWSLLMRREAGVHPPFSTADLPHIGIFLSGSLSWILLLWEDTALCSAGMPYRHFKDPQLRSTLPWSSGIHRHAACKIYEEHSHYSEFTAQHNMVPTQAESSQVGSAPQTYSWAETKWCFAQVLRLKQRLSICWRALLRMAPAHQVLPAPADHLTPMTWRPLKRLTLRRLPKQVRTCLIMTLNEGLSRLQHTANKWRTLPGAA